MNPGWYRAALRFFPMCAFMALAFCSASSEATYEQIRISTPTAEERLFLESLPDLEMMQDDDGAWILLSRPEITSVLRDRGIPVDVQIDDLESYYRSRLEQDGARGGDFGIFHTYDETLSEMNALHAEFPSLTTVPTSIGLSVEGRSLWSMKVSDNPNVDEPEPEVLFDGVHHAREIMTVEVNLHFMRYLCENYGLDPVVTALVENREIWFVPIVNPDGFVYNETTNPNGGGLWRKNRRNNGNGCFGVDPNRNYPFQWVGGGSSTDPCDDTYRGTSPASEPENQAHIAFINVHSFVVWQSYHSVAGMVLFPWGYTLDHTSDDATFRALAAQMASQGGYQIGQPGEILYLVNGGAFDWGYGELSQHDKIFSFTTEISGSGFWPAPSERDPLIAENLQSNIYLCQVAGAYLEVESTSVSGGNNDGGLDPGESDGLVVGVRNIGLIANATGVQARLGCDDPYVTLTDAVSTLGSIGAGQSGNNGSDPFDLSVDATCPEGREVNFRILLTADGGVAVEEVVPLVVGQAPTLYANDFEVSAGGFGTDPSHTATTGAFVRIDPNPTGFQPGDDTTPPPGVFAWVTAQNSSDGTDDVDSGVAATRSPIWDLTGRSHVRLKMNYFFGQRDSGDDPTGDFFRISLSNDGGASFPVNLVTIGDGVSAATWRELQVDLEDFLPLTSQMMLRVQAADGTATGDVIEAGIDDVYLLDLGSGNEPPSTPALLSPPDGAEGQSSTPSLSVSNALDPEADPLTYGFRVYADAELTQLVASVDDLPEGALSTAWVVSPPLAAGVFYWRAFAADPMVRGLFMDPASFSVESTTDVQDAAPASRLLVAGPNPSVGRVMIRYQTPNAPFSRLEIVDVQGRVVRSLEGARWAAGWQERVWDGLDERGSAAPAGIYSVRLVLPNETRSVQIVRLR